MATSFTAAVITKVVDLTVDWARQRLRERWKRRDKSHQARTPREIVTIYGPDRKPLKRITLSHPDVEAEVEDKPKDLWFFRR